ncbi:hypothetical protein SAMN04515620_10761 [Collimonas sp. OK607]|uniref:hypothetical protein n=1 Tax=Collimonas sp. OK607 TaxID=1798194 RepID=UPI0008EEC44D|nr:hypothetical protein [Collimonas sp. OK607]SFA90387.1 hypothetical protein SAMN04515620_10761 [Collimonas sp. OK607]
MNRTNLAWTIAALVLGTGGIYAVFSLDDSAAQDKTRHVVAAQDNSNSLFSPLATGLAASATSSPGKAQDAVNINPFGK